MGASSSAAGSPSVRSRPARAPSAARCRTSSRCWPPPARTPSSPATGAPVGFAGPVGLGVRILADASLRGMRGAVSGANRADEHVVNLDLERDVPDLAFADLRQARGGDRCPRCEGGTFAEHRGIEVGQVFLLGTKYSETMGATFLDAAGTQRPIEMGCYGIGITRTIAAAIEQHHDDAGIIDRKSVV